VHLPIHRSRTLLVTAAFAAAIVASAIGASSASAVLKRLPDGQTVSYQPLLTKAPRPFDSAFTNMDYNGGPIMPSNTIHLVFWSPKGLRVFPGGGSPPQYVVGIERFFRDLAHDSGTDHNVNSVDPEYNDLTGAVAKYDIKLGGVILDRDPFPASQCPVNPPVTNCMTDAQIQAEVEHVAAVHHLQNGLDTETFLLTPPHVVDCFSNQASQHFGGCAVGIVPSTLAAYCAYHQQTLASPMWLYAYDPFEAGVKIGNQLGCEDGHHPNGISDGEIQAGLSHELNESITDPIPNDAWTNGTGANHGMEIGDQCVLPGAAVMGAPLGTHNGQPYNQVINGHFYWYQEEWSNDTNQCVQRITLPTTAPTATFRAKAGSGLSMVFNATGSTAPGGVADYSWQWNAVTNASTVETSSPTISNTFPAGGLYSIGLAVFGPNGQSRGTGGIITTGHSGFTPGFTFSPSSPAKGQAVTFTGRKIISRHPVTTYLWEFGDGSTGSGLSPKHTYAHAGTYKVEVVQFSGVGSAFPGSGAAPISVENVTVH
jgi:hypothetical protein